MEECPAWDMKVVNSNPQVTPKTLKMGPKASLLDMNLGGLNHQMVLCLQLTAPPQEMSQMRRANVTHLSVCLLTGLLTLTNRVSAARPVILLLKMQHSGKVLAQRLPCLSSYEASTFESAHFKREIA